MGGWVGGFEATGRSPRSFSFLGWVGGWKEIDFLTPSLLLLLLLAGALVAL